jgi:hypothetical protein
MNTPRTNLTTIFEDIALPDNNVFDIGQVVQFKKHGSEPVYQHLGVITHIDNPKEDDPRKYIVKYIINNENSLRTRTFTQDEANDRHMTFIAKKMRNATTIDNLTLLQNLQSEANFMKRLEQNLPDTGGGNRKTKRRKRRRNKTKRRRRRHY